jgi:EpsI family protein
MIKEGTFEVLYGCSGLRYLIVAVSLVSLVAATERIRMRSVPFLMLATVVLAILANWIRIFIVMYAGHVTGMRHYFVSDNHKSLGEVVFAGLLLVIYFISRSLPVMTKADIYSDLKASERPVASGSGLKGISALVLAVLGVFSVLNMRAGLASGDYLEPRLNPIPVALGKWQGPFPSKSVWRPSFSGASDSQLFSYVSERGQIDVYLNVYGVQHQGSELVFYSNSLYSPGNWQLVDWQVLNVLWSVIGMQPLITEELTNTGDRWLMGQLYVVGGFRTSSGLFAQMIYGFSTLGQTVPAGVVALAIKCQSDCQSDRELMLELWRNNRDKILHAIPQSINVSGGNN